MLIILGILLYGIMLVYISYKNGYKKGREDIIQDFETIEQKKIDLMFDDICGDNDYENYFM